MLREATLVLPQQDRENNFDLLRIALAVAVIYSHCFPLLGLDGREPGMRFTGVATMGTLAVQGFFAISGFLVAASWLRAPRVRPFLSRRARRIYPGFIVAILFCAIIAAPLGSGRPSILSGGGWLRAGISILQLSSFSLPEAFATNPFPHAINGSLWTIKYEFLGYLVLAAIGAAGLLRKRFIGPILGMLLVGHVANRGFGWQPRGPGLGIFGKPEAWFEFGTYFFAGVMVRLARRGIPMSPMLAGLCAIGLIAASAERTLWVTLSPLFGVYLLFYIAFLEVPALDRITLKGDYSYGIYLYAFPLQQLLIAGFGRGLTPLSLFAAATVLAVGAGVLSWRLVERPFLRRGRRPTAESLVYLPDFIAPSHTSTLRPLPTRRAA